MRILLTGKDGQLGHCLQDVMSDGQHTLFAFDISELDICDAQGVADVFARIQPDIVVNAAAYTAVDKAETEPEVAFAANELGVHLLAEQAQALGIPLIHVSTDYVFDGKAIAPYRPSDVPAPQGVYGASKLAGERALVGICEKHIILRTAWVFSEYGNNFVKTMVRLARERDSLSVVADQYGCPTYAGDLARAILQLCQRYQAHHTLAWGTYHYCGDMPTSWHGFARAIFAEAKSQGLIAELPALTAINTEQYPTPAARPEFSVLDTSELVRLDLRAPSWLSSLSKVIARLSQ